MNSKIKAILSKAYFIGGSPCCGKSTISEFLSKKYNLIYYKIDDYERKHVAMAQPSRHPIMYQYSQMNWDDIWMRPVDLQVQEEFEFYRERFEMVLGELNQFSETDTIIMEGAALLPELFKQLGVDKSRVVYMIPSLDFQVKYYSQRDFIHGILSECSNPEKAFDNWMQRDHGFGEEVKAHANKLGFRVVSVDGSKSIEELRTLVARHFGLEQS